MCGSHRSAVIDQIKMRLKSKKPTRVISTQLVEAGVDLDFPVVYRALAGLDSIAQAAGRCNREGLLQHGRLVVFIPDSRIPQGYLRQAAEISRRLLADGEKDLLELGNFDKFFKELYWLQGNNLDKHSIMNDLKPDQELRFSFLSAAKKFKLIDETQYSPVIVQYSEGAKLIRELKVVGPEKRMMRKLQRYIVNLPSYIHQKLVSEKSIIEIYPGIFAHENPTMYDDRVGFCSDKTSAYKPDDLIC